MSYLAKNNAYGLLASGIASGAVSMTLQSGQGDRFPAITAPDYTFVTLEDAAGNREIVKVTARAAASDVMTIVRAQEGTTARTWNAGDVVELRMVASLVETAMGHPVATSNAHAASAISAPATGTLGAGTVASQLAALEFGKEPAFTALGIAKGGTGGTTRQTALAALGIEAAEVAVQTTANATTDIAAAASENILLTTGATTITGFAATTAGVTRKIRMATGGVTLSPNSTFIVPGAANIVTVAGDCFEAHYGGTAWIVRNYQKADGTALVSPVIPVTSVFGRTGAVAMQQSDITSGLVTGALGYTPANAANAGSDHNHNSAYAPMTAVVSISNPDVNGNSIATRANGTTFNIQMNPN